MVSLNNQATLLRAVHVSMKLLPPGRPGSKNVMRMPGVMFTPTSPKIIQILFGRENACTALKIWVGDNQVPNEYATSGIKEICENPGKLSELDPSTLK